MSGRAALAWSGSALGIVVLAQNPIYRGLVLLVALNVVLARRLPGRGLRPLLLVIGTGFTLSVALNLLLGHAGTTRLGAIPVLLPGVGGAITVESLAFGVASGLGVAAAGAAAAPLALAVESHELIGALPAALDRTGMVLGTAFNLVPGLYRSYRAVAEAQALRGGRRVRLSGEVVVPVTLTALEGSIGLAEAMEARGFGSGPRTHHRAAAAPRSETLPIALAALASLGAFATTRLLQGSLDWYPLPAFHAPPANPLLVASILLLAAPLVRWR